MRRSRPVVITGIGALTAHGLGYSALARALADGAPRAHPIDPFEPLARRGRASRTAASVNGVGWEEWLGRRDSRRMSPPSIYGVVAARMALADAGRDLADAPEPDHAVVLATTFGTCSYSQRLLDQIFEQGPDAISPFLFMESVANAPAGQVAILCAAAGPNLSLCLREAGPVAAVGRAAAEVAAGRATRALAGATEEMTPLLHGVLDRFGSLSDRPRPLDAARDGFLAGEGSLVLALEAESEAERRGARPRARVRAWGGAFDPSAPGADWGSDPSPLADSVLAGLERTGLSAGDLGAVVCGASGSRRGDRLEAAVIRAVFDRLPVPPVFAPKGVTGEYAGAYLAAGLAALEGRAVSAPAGFTDPDPEVGLAPWTGPDPGPVGRVLVTGLGAGGAAAWIVLERP